MNSVKDYAGTYDEIRNMSLVILLHNNYYQYMSIARNQRFSTSLTIK